MSTLTLPEPELALRGEDWDRLAREEIDGDPAYPIYVFNMEWEEPEEGNSGSGRKMFREEPSEGELVEALEGFLDGYRDRREIVEVTNTEIRYLLHETWCLTWFQHYTFDVGQSDDEALASFSRYVGRHQWYQDPMMDLDERKRIVRERQGHAPITLMGAEDRWRWKASPEGSGLMGPANDGDPPCRCEHCQEQGVIRISH